VRRSTDRISRCKWLRDPERGHPAELPVDVPQGEPELLAAMLAMRLDG